MESYKFYVQMDGQVYGPYTAAAVNNLQLLDDTLVTEESMNGEWLPASRFDFEEMMRKESAPSFRVNRDGSITYDQAPEATTTPSQSNPTRATLSNGSSHVNIPNSATRSDYSYSSGSGRSDRAEDVDLSKWNWGAFFFSGLWSLFNGVWWFFPIIFISACRVISWLGTTKNGRATKLSEEPKAAGLQLRHGSLVYLLV
jgi:hypothetical protein